MNYASLAAVKRHWLVIVLMSLLGAALAFLISMAITPLYRATTSLYFTLNFGNTASDLAQGSTYTSNQMVSFGELATAPVVLEPVIEKLGLNMTTKDLAAVVDVSTPRDTVIMQIAVTSVDPQTAADIANAIGTQAGATIEEFAPQRENGKPSVQVRTIAQATPPEFQFVPDKRLNTAGGFILGGLLGVAAAFILSALDNRVRNEESLTQVTKAPYLGTLGLRSDSVGHEAVVFQDPASHSAEEYRQLRSSLRFSTLSRHPLVLVVSSPVPGDGKTTVATNLAGTWGEAGQKVLLIDADLRRPRVADYTHVINAVGLCDVLVGEASLAHAVQPLQGSGVDVLTAGDIPPNPGELVGSTRMAELLADARTRYDVIIIDTAPIMAVADAPSLMHNADGALLVVRSGVTHKKDLGASVDTLEAAGGTVFGIVINGSKSGRSLRDYQYSSNDPDLQQQPAAADGKAVSSTKQSAPAERARRSSE